MVRACDSLVGSGEGTLVAKRGRSLTACGVFFLAVASAIFCWALNATMWLLAHRPLPTSAVYILVSVRDFGFGLLASIFVFHVLCGAQSVHTTRF